jgi:GGDEF domain-containing protein
MTNENGPPKGKERRAYRTYNVTLNKIELTPRPPTLRAGDPLKRCSSRAHFLELLEGQIAHSLVGQYPLCLAAVEFLIECNFCEVEPVLYAVAMHFSLSLRPTDIIVRYQTKSLALILHDVDACGGKNVSERLTRKLPEVLRFGREDVRVTPLFGFSTPTVGNLQRAEEVLLQAEASLINARKMRQSNVAQFSCAVETNSLL